MELLLLLLHSLRGLGVLGGCIPCGKAGSLRGLRRVGALGMQRPWGAWSSDGAWRVNFLTQGAEMEPTEKDSEGKTP